MDTIWIRNRLLLSVWKAYPRQARLWELWEWWGSSASSEWLVYHIYNIFIIHLSCIIIIEVPPHLPNDPPFCWSSKSDLYPASGPTSSSSSSSSSSSWSGLARAWVESFSSCSSPFSSSPVSFSTLSRTDLVLRDGERKDEKIHIFR